MKIEDAMISPVFTLKRDNTIRDALHLIEEKGIRHIPIVDDGNQVIGIVTERDLRSALPSVFFRSIEGEDVLERPLESIMNKDVITAHPLDFLEEASLLFYKYQIGCLPIVKENQLVGIITATDVLRTFLELTGASQPGSQMEIRIENRPGELEKILHRISEKQMNIHSILIYPDPKSKIHKIVVIRIETINPNPLADLLRQDGFQVLWPKGVNA